MVQGAANSLQLATGSPVDQLPTELLAHIFCLTRPTVQFHTDDRFSPLLLGAICRSWRSIAWFTQELWTYIHINPSTRNSYSFRQQDFTLTLPKLPSIKGELLKEWLARAVAAPLTIVLRLFKSDRLTPRSAPLLHNTEDLLLILASESERWKSLEVDIPNVACADILNDALRRVPQIQKLRVRVIETLAGIHFRHEVINLTHLSLETSLHMAFAPISWSPGFSRKITTLYLNNMTTNQTIPLLLLVRNTLRYFHVELSDIGTVEEVDDPPTDFPQLETLVLRRGRVDVNIDLGRYFHLLRTTPRLRKLAISITYWDFVELDIFLDRLGVSLEALRLQWEHNFPLQSADDVVEMLSTIIQPHSETLQELAFVVSSLDIDLGRFVGMVHTMLYQGDTLVLPSMTSYEFHVGGHGVSSDHLKALLPTTHAVKRWWNARRDQSQPVARKPLKISLPDINRERMLQGLATEMREGLQVHFMAIGCNPLPIRWRFED